MAAQSCSVHVSEDELSKKYLGMIMNSAERAADLAAKLLAFGRKQQKASIAVDVHRVISDTVSILLRVW